jgi:hypothetical protein
MTDASALGDLMDYFERNRQINGVARINRHSGQRR